ncbi:MAG TPA: SDR family oxidoreductase [Pseudolabrys sp.]|nr:SDR family oxidoreductase [Pseudolabrys sp.]
MRVLLLGASGLVGSALAAQLVSRGDEYIAVVHRVHVNGLAKPASTVELDISKARDVSDWLPSLKDVDAVVNCAGVLQDSLYDSVHGVHAAGVATLFTACERAGVRRIIHLSAVGVDRATTEFSQTKLAGEQILMQSALDWVILRPSIVIGSQAYGASALMRALAAMPLLPSIPSTGPLQPVHLDDLVSVILFFLQPSAPVRQVVDVVGPRIWSFDQLVMLLRRWLRFGPARVWPMPRSLAGLSYRCGDLFSLLGWRPPVRTTAAREIARGAVGNPEILRELALAPRDIEDALLATPASVQERWFARLYLLKPAIFILLALFWIGTGMISLTSGWCYGMGLMHEAGVSDATAGAIIVAGASADLVIGATIAWRPAARWGLYAAIAISLLYAVIGTALVPRLWNDPLGPMLKIWPIVLLHGVALAVFDDR